jgi:hypothetical protein
VNKKLVLLSLLDFGPSEMHATYCLLITADDVPKAAPSFENGVTGWELALVTAPSSNETAAASGKKLVRYIFSVCATTLCLAEQSLTMLNLASLQAGGLDLLTLDSLYDDANRRASQPASYNPWETPGAAPMMQQPAPMQDPFYGSNGYAAPHAVQMAAMAQQQQAFMLQQQMMMASHHPQVHQQQFQAAPANPFGANPFAPAGAHHPYGGASTGMMPLHAGTGNTYTGLI